MAVRHVVDLLACPHCARALAMVAGDRSVSCSAGHLFDVARQGHLNLSRSGAPRNADTATMVSARDRFLASGHYRAVADRLAALAGGHSRTPRVLDVGTGTGYYLARLLDASPAARGIGLDVSVAAARRAARAHPRLGAVVADAWQVLPVVDGSIDVVLDVFAPRNAAEFARVLAPGGVLVTATPAPDHVQEVRDALGLLDIQAGKHDQLRSGLAAASLGEVSTETLRFECALDMAAVRDLIAMGPNAFHLSDAEIADRAASLPTPVGVTVAVDLTVWTRSAGRD